MSVVFIAVGAGDAAAQTAGSTAISVSGTERKEGATGSSEKKQLQGNTVHNDAGQKNGQENDLIVAPNKQVSYAIVEVGGFLGMGERDVAVPMAKLTQQMGKIVLPGATKDAL